MINQEGAVLSEVHKKETSAATDPQPNKKRRRRRWFIVGGAVGVLVLLLLLVVAILPALISGGLMRGTILGIADNAIEGSITWDKLDVSWGKGQRIEGLKILDTQGKVLLTVAKVDVPSVSLWSIVWGAKQLGTIEVVIDQGSIIQEADGQFNLAKALATVPSKTPATPKKTSSPSPQTQPLDGWTAKLDLKTSGVQITPLGAQPIEITRFNVTGDLSDPASAMKLNFDAAMTQNQRSAGSANGQVSIHDLMNSQGDFQLEKAKVDVNVTLDKIASSLLMSLAGQNAKLAAILGPDISAGLNVNGNLLSPSGRVTANSTQLDVDLKFDAKDNEVTLAPDSAVKFTLDQKGWDAWQQRDAKTQTADSEVSVDQTKLLQPVTLAMVVKKFSLPRQGQAMDLAALAAEVSIGVTDVNLQTAGELGKLSLTGTKATLQTQALGKAAEIRFDATASQNQQQGSVHFVTTANDLADAQGQLGLTRVNADVQAKVTNLPLSLADELLGLDGKLTGLLGPTLEASLTTSIKPSVDGTAASGPFALKLVTRQLTTNIQGSLSPDAFAIDGTSSMELMLTPASAEAAGLPPKMLVSPAKIQLKFEQALIPRHAQGLALDQAKLKLTLASSALQLADVGQVKLLGIGGLIVALDSDGLGKSIQLAAEVNVKADAQAAAMKATAQLSDLMDSQGKLKLDTMHGSYQVDSQALPVAMLDALAGQSGTLAKWLGDTLNIHSQGQLLPGASLLEQGKLSLTVTSPQLKLNTQARLEKGVLKVEPASKVVLTLATDALASNGLTLASAPVVTVTLGNISLPVSPLRLEEASIEGITLATTPMKLAGKDDKAGYTLGSLDGKVVAARLGDALSVSLKTKVEQDGAAAAPILVEANLNHPLAGVSDGQLKVSLQQLATAYIDALAGQDGRLLALLGPEIQSLTITAKPELPAGQNASASSNAGVWLFDMSAKSTQLQAPLIAGRFVAGDVVTLTTPKPITLQVTPQAYELLLGVNQPPKLAEKSNATTPVATAPKRTNPVSKLLGGLLSAVESQRQTPAKTAKPVEPFKLASPFEVVLNIAKADLRMDTPSAGSAVKTPTGTSGTQSKNAAAQAFDLHRVSFDVTATLNHMVYERKTTGDRVKADKLVASIKTPINAADKILLQVTGDTLTTAKNESSQVAEAKVDSAKGDVKGKIDARLAFENLVLLPEIGLDWQRVRSQWNVTMNKLPVVLLDNLAGMEGRLSGLLGSWSDLSMQGRLPGDLDLKLSAPHASVDGALKLSDAFELTLRHDMKVRVEITPESVQVMGLLSPQLLALESSQEPVDLTIHQKDFYLPLPGPGEALDLKKIRSDLTLELGQVVLRKEGMVKTVYEVLDRFGGKFNSKQLMDVRFTPMEVELKNGHLKTDDMWLVSDELLMGTQAQIDLTQEPAFAHVFLAISGQTLRKMPGARKNIPPDYVVEVAVASPLSEVKLNYADLVLQMTPLFVTTYAGKEGGEVMGVLGGVVDRLKTLGKDNDKQLIKVKWPHHPQPVLTPEEARQAGNAKAAEQKKEKSKEKDVVDSLLDLFK